MVFLTQAMLIDHKTVFVVVVDTFSKREQAMFQMQQEMFQMEQEMFQMEPKMFLTEQKMFVLKIVP